MRSATCRQAGFTLLEVLVAVVILGLAYVAILQSLSLSNTLIARLDRKRGERLATALAFAREAPAAQGEIFLRGSKFKVLHYLSEDGQLETLRLVKEER